jgi:hypothetical protein
MMRKFVLPINLTFTSLILAMLIYSVMQGNHYDYWTEAISLILLWIPPLLAWSKVVDLPWPISLGAGMALSIHSFGLVSNLYYTTEWWSHFTHSVSGIVVGSVITTALIIMIQQAKTLHVPIALVPFFIFISVLAFEGFWKIFEFTMDHTMNTMMGHGLEDLMNDNLSDTLAGIVVGLIAAYYIRHTSIRTFVENLKAEKTLARLRRRFFSKP